MIKKLISLILVFVMVASVLCIDVLGAGVAGKYYYTDIKTYVRGQLIDSYNVGGKTVILCEALQSYGFNVLWDGTARTLTITDRNGSALSNASDSQTGAIGAVAGNYFYTDIVTYFNGAKMESYNLGGRTVIPAADLRNLGYDVVWDAQNRRVLIDTDTANFVAGTAEITNLTPKPVQNYHGNIAITADAVNFNGNRLITSHDCYIETSLDKKIYVPFKAFADCIGVSYAWNSGTATLTVNVPSDKIIKAKADKAKTNYKNYGVVDQPVQDVVLNIVNGTKTYNNVDAIAYGTELFVEAQSLALAFDFFCFNQVDYYTRTMAYIAYTGYNPY